MVSASTVDACVTSCALAYQLHVEDFCKNSPEPSRASKLNLSTTSTNRTSTVLADLSMKRQSAVDKMKQTHGTYENDENSKPPSVTTPKSNGLKKNSLQRFAFSTCVSTRERILSIAVRQVSIPILVLSMRTLLKYLNHRKSSFNGSRCHSSRYLSSRKRTNENQSSCSSVRFEHATNRSSYFAHRTDNRISPLLNIHSKPLNSSPRLWDDDSYSYDWRHSPYSTKRLDQPTSSLPHAMASTTNLRKKG